jgi:copper resistance protein B
MRLSAQPTSNDAALAAAFPDLGGMDARTMMLEDPIETFVLFDQFERREGNDAMSWDLEAWSGRNLDKLFVRSEGERESGRTEQAEVELFWAHGVAPWWDLVAGIRHDTAPGPSRSWAAFGVQGFAPYSFDIEATAYLGEGSHAAARVEADFELLITQRLVLQPLAELRWYSRDDPERALGSGLSSVEIGLRLRYEFRREIAPYIGITRSRLYGGTADYARAQGGDTDETQWVAGLRFWF